MAYLTVTTPFDVVAPGDGQLSLREAIEQANASSDADTIRFVAALEGKTLVLTGGELPITQDLTIDGDRNDDGSEVTIDGNANGRILNISGADTKVALTNLTLANGYFHAGGSGGAVLVEAAQLVGNSITIRDSHTDVFGGGAISAENGSRLELINSAIFGNYSTGGDMGGAIKIVVASGFIDDCIISDNGVESYMAGGGIGISNSVMTISRSSVVRNVSRNGGGIFSKNSKTTIVDSTIAHNTSQFSGGISPLENTVFVLRNSTVTGNYAEQSGGGIGNLGTGGDIEVENTLISGNISGLGAAGGPDIFGFITSSNGHNIFGSDVLGNVSGDRENVAGRVLFATIDPATGGGKLGPDGTVALRNNVANPALSAGDPLAASAFDQRGFVRPQPAGSLPDLGAVELNQPLSTGSTANNDVRSGTNAANNLTGLAGNDYLKGLGGNDTADGGPGSDLLDGGPGNDKLTGGTGVDLVAYPGAAAVVVDLSGTNDTAKRGGETDTLIGIEGALGSGGADRFKGDALSNEFQGKAGKDTMTGSGGRDTWFFKEVADSPAGALRDVVTDFDPSTDVLDLAGIDADSSVPGNQSFRWIAKVTLTGAAQLGYFVSGGMTIVRASTDADAAPEVEIQLTGAKTLTEVDFRP